MERMSIGTRGRPHNPLQRETVVRAALQLLDEVGLDALTMRRLAAHLDIQNPSLYNHITNKQELLNCMADLMIADSFVDLHSAGQNQSWADWLGGFARLLRRMMLGHRDGARILAEADLSRSKLPDGIELALEALQYAGFDAREAMAGVMTTIQFVLGNAFQAQAEPLLHQHGSDEKSPGALDVPIDGERLPRIAAFLQTTDVLSPAGAEAQFEERLSLILDGLRAKLAT
jgi:TetR/AcrR family tetracycline transcriptional repressor